MSLRSTTFLLGSLLVGCSQSSVHPPSDAGRDVQEAAPPPDGTTCGIPFLGDPSMPPAIQPIALGADGTSSPLSDGSTIALLFPPQGGRVIFVGAHATNI